MSQHRPVMLSEVSFSAPSTNTSFPAEYPNDPMLDLDVTGSNGPDFYEVDARQYQKYQQEVREQEAASLLRCESPTPRKMELHEERRMLQRSQNKHDHSRASPARPAMDLPPKDFGRSPSPDPFRNYSSMGDEDSDYQDSGATDLGTRTPVYMDSSATSAPLSATTSTDCSERIRAMTARIEYLHSKHAPSPQAREPELLVVGTAVKLHPSPSALHREEVDTSCEEENFGPHRRPRSPPSSMAPIARHLSEPNHSVPRTEHRHLMTQGQQCLQQINESLDELRDLLPTSEDVDAAVAHVVDVSITSSQVSQAKSRRRVMRINELCTKLDGLASIAYEMKLVAEDQKKRRHSSGPAAREAGPAASELDNFLEEISRKADSMAFVLEQLAHASAQSRQTTGSSDATSTRLHQHQLAPHTEPMPRASPSQDGSSTVASSASSQHGHRALLSQKHTSSVMDTIEMMADTVLRLADRLDNQNEVLLMTLERQQEQQDDVEVTKAVLADLYHGASAQQTRVEEESMSSYLTVTENQQPEHEGEYVLRPDPMDVEDLAHEQEEVRALPQDVTPNRPRVPINYRPLYSESSVGDDQEEEGGYVLMDRSGHSDSSSSAARGYQTADRFQPKVSVERATNSTINMSAEQALEEFQHVTTIHSSVSRHSTASMSAPRSAPHRKIVTPGATSVRRHQGTGTMTEALMSPLDESGEALHTSRASVLATQPKLNMYNSAMKQRSGERSAPGTLRSHVLPSDASSVASSVQTNDVSRSLFIEDDQNSSRPTSASTQGGRHSRSSTSSGGKGHPYYVSSVASAQKEHMPADLSRELFTDKKGSKKSKRHHVDAFTGPTVLDVEKRIETKQHRSEDKLRAAYTKLQKENQSLKVQLDSALSHKDHYRVKAEGDQYSSILRGSAASPLY